MTGGPSSESVSPRDTGALDSVLKSTMEFSSLLQTLNSNWYYRQEE